MSALEIDVFWSFRSPWSYLATPRLRALQAEWDLVVNFRPVYPIAVRTPEFFLNASPMWGPYLMLDVHRCAEFLGLPFKWPSPDPVAQYRGDDGKPRTADEQPYIARLTRLGVVAQEQGRGIEFADEISKAIWTGHENWHEGDHLARATDKAGLNLAAMDALVESGTERLEAMIAKNQEDHTRAGHWGVPTCAFKGEPFFGQDRLDVLVWRLKKAGLQARSNARA
jgi:2-hydroxychromene-2-carboxylate isomerase